MPEILTKTLRDGSTATISVEPAGETDWQLRVDRPAATDTTKARPYKLPRSQKGISHALTVKPGKDGFAVGLTAREADALNRAINYFADQRLKAARAKRRDEAAALSARLRATVADAPTWTISSPHGVPSAGGTTRLEDGRIVTSLRAWRRYYREDGMVFGAAEDAGYVYYAEVREATAGEAAPLIEQETSRRQRKDLVARVKTEIIGHAERPDAEQIPDLLTLPDVQVTPLVHLRIDRGAGGDNWAYNNYCGYIATCVHLTEARNAVLAQLGAMS